MLLPLLPLVQSRPPSCPVPPPTCTYVCGCVCISFSLVSGHYNHCLFWNTLCNHEGSGTPSPKVLTFPPPFAMLSRSVHQSTCNAERCSVQLLRMNTSSDGKGLSRSLRLFFCRCCSESTWAIFCLHNISRGTNASVIISSFLPLTGSRLSDPFRVLNDMALRPTSMLVMVNRC